MEKFGLKILIDLISKMGDMDIDDIGPRIEVIIPYSFRDHRSGDDLPRMSHEKLKKPIFFWGKFNLYLISINSMSVYF
jgi:hypothetical protein